MDELKNDEYERIGHISESLLVEIKLWLQGLNYSKKYDWVIECSGLISRSEPIVEAIIQELEPLIRPRGFKSAVVNKMPKLSYIPEHSDVMITKRSNMEFKLHIPIVTNSQVGFMWPGHERNREPRVTQFEAGGIYLFNNVAKHSVVNLSNEDRYHFIIEFETIDFPAKLNLNSIL